MKKIKLFSKVAMIALGLAIIGNSCTNLDETLYTTINSDNFYKTDAEFTAALGAIYTNMYGSWGGTSGLWTTQEVSSDEMIVPQRGGDWYDGGKYIRMKQHQSISGDDIINGAWNVCFTGVQTCNRLIYQLTSADPAKAAPFIAEIKVMRAFYYYYLLDIFGNVPIVTSFPVTEANPGTKPASAVYAFIESELTANVPNLSKSVDASTYGRMNYWGGRFLQAKLYLNAKVYSGTDQSAKALVAAKEIIDGKAYSLSTTFHENFITANEGSKEAILAIPYDAVNAGGFQMGVMTLYAPSQSTYKFTAQPWDGYCTAEEFYNSFDDADTRKAASFITGPQYASDGKTPLSDAAVDPTPTVNYTPAVNQLYPKAYHQAGARIGKWEFAIGANPGNLSNDYAVFRYADVLLMASEANFNLGNTATALTQINQIRTRAGVPNFTVLDAPTILAERGRELFAEGWRRSDMIRFGTYSRPFDWHYDANIRNKAGTEKACVTLMPIPKSQIDANSGLIQNDCYK